ncbi:TetR/AcrR family transcriptional regulator [Nocardioides sp. CER19]|uniref:TetR/AcrR family transcriptional regulator n=1 Tax=Nocardioides sp. CER19 TaxID=3038538 RepID=UPI00244B55F9|nr:TetR/AcrR family transcriptional regulator [Nocardioides sp. CER19]MDH2412696.1 TetR/AcrR family transcriptional regulator [Nocardioides sp. CER19]
MTETRPRGTTRRAALVAAAVSCIEELGPGVGMAQIAERAGVPRPHVYRVIASKDELDAEVGRLAADMFVEKVRPAVAQPATLRDTVHDAVAASVEWAAEHPNLYRFLAARQHARAATGPRQGRGRFLEMLVASSSEYLRRTGGDVAAVPTADGVFAGIMGLIDASIIWWLDHQDETQQQVVERVARQVTLIQQDLLAQLGISADDYSVLGRL